MAVQADTYNSRVTDEALEKKFRDTFKSQSGAALVNDLYASGTIVPIVDFTSAAEGSALRSDLQSAWDLSTGFSARDGVGTNVVINSTGFWLCNILFRSRDDNVANDLAFIYIQDGATLKNIWAAQSAVSPNSNAEQFITWKETVFLTSGQELKFSIGADHYMSVAYRQIADVNGNLTNPLGFTSS